MVYGRICLSQILVYFLLSYLFLYYMGIHVWVVGHKQASKDRLTLPSYLILYAGWLIKVVYVSNPLFTLLTMFHLLFVICFIALSVTQNINIGILRKSFVAFPTLNLRFILVEQKSLVCFVDEVQFTISKGVNGKKIKTKNGKCSKTIGDQRLVTFNYKNCDAKIVYLVYVFVSSIKLLLLPLVLNFFISGTVRSFDENGFYTWIVKRRNFRIWYAMFFWRHRRLVSDWWH